LIGPHAGDLRTLVQHYLPKPAIDRNTWRMVELIEKRLDRGRSMSAEQEGAGKPVTAPLEKES
jgi:hypothetical protein